MKKISEKEARKAGAKLLLKMAGHGWHLRVWENMGWHYCAQNGGMTVHLSSLKHEKYFALLDYGSGGGGLAHWTDQNIYADPNKAVRVQLEIAQKYIRDGLSFLDLLSDRLFLGG